MTPHRWKALAVGVTVPLLAWAGAAEADGPRAPAPAEPSPTSEPRSFPYRDGATYAVLAAPGRITDIVLEPGERLVGTGPIAAGDTARWVIGDTTSGEGGAQRVHVLVKPVLAGLATNLIINTNRRTYRLDLRSTARTWLSEVAWRYPEPPAAAAAAAASAPVMAPAPAEPDLSRLDFAYRIKGPKVAWRPVRVFDDGRRTLIEFAPAIVLAELPPLFAVGSDGRSSELVNYHIAGRRIVVDRILDRAELRLGQGRGERRVRLIRGNGPMSGTIHDEEKDIAKTLRLRAPAPAVTRVSRSALVICGAILAAGLAGALGWSLMERRKVEPEPAFAPAPPPPEGIANLPRDYVGRPGVPVLGPPLPGDLGRPILRAEAEGREVVAGYSPPGAVSPGRLTPAQGVPRASEIARGLFVATATPPALPPAVAVPAAPPIPEADPRLASAERLQPPASPYILQAGAVIPAALVTGLRSDVAGMAIAQVTEAVFDSLGGGHLLIPQGARLVGEYDAEIAGGQTRLGVVWTRLILPSGRSIVLGKLPGADTQGMAGLKDGVDRHGRGILAAAALSTVLAIGSESSTSGASELERAIRRGAAEGVTDVGQQMVGRSLARAPTLTIRPGAPLRVLVARDLVLEP